MKIAHFWRCGAGGRGERHSSLVGYSGFRYVRVTVRWWQVEAAPGHYDWSSVHAEVDLAAQLGLPVLARVFGTPDWASGAPARQCDPGNLFAKTLKQLNAPTSTGAYSWC